MTVGQFDGQDPTTLFPVGQGSGCYANELGVFVLGVHICDLVPLRESVFY
jgi:hypothetical protein